VSEVHVVLPNDIDDPATPSGGNAYDRRVCRGLAALGWSVREHAVAGGWPSPLPAERAIHLLRQTCQGLREAHAIGLIHRDIKPGNIFAAERGGLYDVAKLLDFGLVKPVAEIPSARLTWYPQGFETAPRSLNWGVELEYARGTGRNDQRLASNEYISLGGNNLQGPQEVHHRAELRYGHLGVTGSQRFGGRASSLEIEWLAGLGAAEFTLVSQSRIAGSPALSARQGLSGVTLGVGPRWNITNELALEGRLQVLHLGPSFGETLWYPEIAVRYRPAKAVALRMGYSSMSFDPSKQNGGDSAVRVRISGPFLGLHLVF